MPNSGNVFNGLIQAGQGIAKENYTWPCARPSRPRIGAAYDLTGTQKMVVRGNFGMFYDRPENNMTANQIGNPPNSTATTLRYAQLQTLGSAGLQTRAPAQLLIYQYDSKLPTTLQWSTGVQMMLPWSSSLDVSYVGSHGYNLVNPFNQPIDINSVDLGAAFLPQNQDPTQSSATPGAAALTTDLLRPFPGYGAINLQWGRFWNQFDSIQTAFNRRFRDGLGFGLNYTLTLRQTGTNDLNSADSVRLVHNADGTFSDDPTWAQAEKNLREQRPAAPRDQGELRVGSARTCTPRPRPRKVLGAVVNDWQLSGILTAGSGARYTVDLPVPERRRQREPDRLAELRGAHPIVGDPGSGCSDDQYSQFNVSAFAGPQPGSKGLESGRNYMVGCPDKTLDLLDPAQHPDRRRAADPAPPRSLQRVEHHRLQRAADAAAAEQPDRSDGPQRAVQRRRLDQQHPAPAAQRRLRRGHRRAGDAECAGADAVPVLSGWRLGEQLQAFRLRLVERPEIRSRGSDR